VRSSGEVPRNRPQSAPPSAPPNSTDSKLPALPHLVGVGDYCPPSGGHRNSAVRASRAQSWDVQDQLMDSDRVCDLWTPIECAMLPPWKSKSTGVSCVRPRRPSAQRVDAAADAVLAANRIRCAQHGRPQNRLATQQLRPSDSPGRASVSGGAAATARRHGVAGPGSRVGLEHLCPPDSSVEDPAAAHSTVSCGRSPILLGCGRARAAICDTAHATDYSECVLHLPGLPIRRKILRTATLLV
jgi:hypothetical protein